MPVRRKIASALIAAVASFASVGALADPVTDWGAQAAKIATVEPMTPRAVMTVALAQVSVYEAVNSITRRYPKQRFDLGATAGASIDAAVAAANRVILSKYLPEAARPSIEETYRAALAAIPEGDAKTRGIAVGERAAQRVMELRATDAWTSPEGYRPRTMPGVYVPTAAAVFSHWSKRTGWFLQRTDQFRPAPPLKLDSEEWTRNYEEVRLFGARDGSRRTPEQTEIARVWQTTAPNIYYQVVSSLATQPNREVTRNARLYATATQAMDDAMIAVFDAKYAYEFWRPVTAIRNGDLDGNDATPRDATWTPLIETPMHPEYPCAHCVLAGAVGAVLKADIGSGPTPELSTTSPTAPGVVRKWNKVDDFVQEVTLGRIYDGVHYRFSGEVGTDIGRKVGELAVETNMR